MMNKDDERVHKCHRHPPDSPGHKAPSCPTTRRRKARETRRPAARPGAQRARQPAHAGGTARPQLQQALPRPGTSSAAPCRPCNCSPGCDFLLIFFVFLLCSSSFFFLKDPARDNKHQTHVSMQARRAMPAPRTCHGRGSPHWQPAAAVKRAPLRVFARKSSRWF